MYITLYESSILIIVHAIVAIYIKHFSWRVEVVFGIYPSIILLSEIFYQFGSVFFAIG